MARRFSAPYQSEPVSSLATWARNLALFSVIAVVVSIAIAIPDRDSRARTPSSASASSK